MISSSAKNSRDCLDCVDESQRDSLIVNDCTVPEGSLKDCNDCILESVRDRDWEDCVFEQRQDLLIVCDHQPEAKPTVLRVLKPGVIVENQEGRYSLQLIMHVSSVDVDHASFYCQ